MLKYAVSKDAVDDLMAAILEESGEEGLRQSGLGGFSTSQAGRHFSLGEDVRNHGIYEDALDKLGSSLEAIAMRMKTFGYSEHQIETAARSGILGRLILTWSRTESVSLQDIIGDHGSLIAYLWNERGLELFEFQSTKQGRVNQVAFPWTRVREQVMRYIAQIASEQLKISPEEAYVPYERVNFPPVQIWGMLVTTRLWEFCDETEFRDWWSKYAVCEYVNQERPEELILNVKEIDRWAPAGL